MARKNGLKKDGTPKGKPRGTRGRSTTGKKNPKVDQTSWRTQLQRSRIKFDDEQKAMYCQALAEHGLKDRAALSAGITPVTARRHLDNDPDFAEAADISLSVYMGTVSDEVRRRGRDGVLKELFHKGARVFAPMIDADGKIYVKNEAGDVQSADAIDEVPDGFKPVMIPAFERVYDTRLLEMEAKRVNPEYREKQTIDLNTTDTGVLVAPAELTPEEYIAKGDRLNLIADQRHADVEAAKAKGS